MVSRFFAVQQRRENSCSIYLDLGLQTYPVITLGQLAESSSCFGYSCSEFVIKCVSTSYSATKVADAEHFSDWKLDTVDCCYRRQVA